MERMPNNQQEILTPEDREVFSRFGLGESSRAVNENAERINPDGDIFFTAENIGGNGCYMGCTKTRTFFTSQS